MLLASAAPPGDQANLDVVKIGTRPSTAPVTPHFESFKFGIDSQGSVEIDAARLKGKPPIIIEVTGWRSSDLSTDWIPWFVHKNGYRFATVHAEWKSTEKLADAQAASLARGIAALVAKADQYGFDPHRIILRGSAIGGNFAVLLATDPSYLEQAGVPFASIRGVVSFDGAGFDLVA